MTSMQQAEQPLRQFCEKLGMTVVADCGFIVSGKPDYSFKSKSDAVLSFFRAAFTFSGSIVCRRSGVDMIVTWRR